MRNRISFGAFRIAINSCAHRFIKRTNRLFSRCLAGVALCWHQLADDAAHGEFSIPIAHHKLAEMQEEAHRLMGKDGVGGKIVWVV